jgi:transcriptional regulator with XRE-family HTH domain
MFEFNLEGATMLTEFGKFVRKLRIDNGTVLGDMAKSIAVSSAYLSSVENGKKNITEQLLDQIVEYFSLDKSQALAIRKAAENSPVSVKFDLKDSPSDERMLVNAFARQVSDLSANQKSEIFEILNKNFKKGAENE